METITREWMQWIDINLQESSDINDLILLKNTLCRNFPSLNINQEIVNRIYTIKGDKKRIQFPSNLMEMYIVKNFLNDKECKDIIRASKSNFTPSTVVDTGIDKKQRSSTTCHYSNSSKACQLLLDQLQKKICNYMNISVDYTEKPQIQQYCRGNQFKLHHDFFHDTTLSETQCEEYGNRTWTCMIFLNDVEKGGETHFENLNIKVKPEEGMALIWNNLLPDSTPNYNTLHAGLPVIRGKKYIITQWFREKEAIIK